MAADTQHAQTLEKLGDLHEKRMIDALAVLEDRIAKLAASAPLQGGKLFDLEWAIAARRDILKLMTEEYLNTANRNVSDYKQAAESATKMISRYTDFVGLSPEVIGSLQRVSFQGFEDIAGTFLNELSGEIYQNTLTGRTIDESIKAIRQKINGVYAQSDQAEVAKLVNIANAGGADADEAIKKLHSVYAADKLGNNMRRYATQMVHDSLMQFDASVNVTAGKETGAEHWKYYGSTVQDSREFCREHAGKVYTEDEINTIWEGNWAGKAAGNPFIVRGGYNCRHHWRPYYKDVAQEVTKEAKSDKFVASKEIVGEAEAINKFESVVNTMTPEQIRIANKIDSIKEFETLKGGGYYLASEKKLASPLDDISTIRHEFGHHVDGHLFALRNGKGFGDTSLSVVDDGFNKAIAKDRKNLGFTKSFASASKPLIDGFYEQKIITKTVGNSTRIYQKIQPKVSGQEGISDIFDALSKGGMANAYGVYGHGKTYFKGYGQVQREIFANLWELRSTPHWDDVKKYVPNLAARFDEMLEEFSK
jgi:hypothetical protein